MMESERSSSDAALLMLLVDDVELVELGIAQLLVLSFRPLCSSRCGSAGFVGCVGSAGVFLSLAVFIEAISLY